VSSQSYTPTQNVPFSQEAEEATIGSVLVNPKMATVVAAFLKPEDFFLLRNHYIWEAIIRLLERGAEVDYLLVIEELRAMNRLDGIGGEVYVIGLFRNTPTSIHAEAYGRLVERASLRRRLMNAADEQRGLAMNENMAIEEVVTAITSRLIKVTSSVLGRATKHISEAIDLYFTEMGLRKSGQAKSAMVPSGFADIDTLLGGFPRKQIALVGGKPGSGKTSLLLGSALNNGKLGVRSVIGSLERTSGEVMEALLSIETGIPRIKLMTEAVLSETEAKLLDEASKRLASLPIFIIDTSDLRGQAMTPDLFALKVKNVVMEQGVDIVYLDYIQLMTSGQFEPQSPADITDCSWKFKQLCIELNCAGVAAAQYNRGLTTKKAKRPTMFDFLGGSGLERNAIMAMHLHNDEVEGTREIIVDKNNLGEITQDEGQLRLAWNKYCTKFFDWNGQYSVDVKQLQRREDVDR
jgi:replicative DNA helicase